MKRFSPPSADLRERPTTRRRLDHNLDDVTDSILDQSVKRPRETTFEMALDDIDDAAHTRFGPPTGEPSAKCTRETTLEMVPNELDDDTHARLDTAVDLVAEEPSNLKRAGFLLISIASNSEGRLNNEYTNVNSAQALLKGYPELIDKLRVAWSAGKFKEIRNLSVYILVLALFIHDKYLGRRAPSACQHSEQQTRRFRF